MRRKRNSLPPTLGGISLSTRLAKCLTAANLILTVPIFCVTWSHGDSNPEPPPCKGGALPVELWPLASLRTCEAEGWSHLIGHGFLVTAFSWYETVRSTLTCSGSTDCAASYIS